MVHLEQPYSGPAHGGDANHAATLLPEMLAPYILPRMEQAAHFLAVGVDASEIRTFVQIAVRTCQSKVFRDSGSSVLPRDNMLNVEGHNTIHLGEAAVFAPVARPFPRQSP
jgi:hypothetical protein